MLDEPGCVKETCEVTLSKWSCKVSRNPVFIASETTRVQTPAATPITLNTVTSLKTAGRFGERRYRCAINHSMDIVLIACALEQLGSVSLCRCLLLFLCHGPQ